MTHQQGPTHLDLLEDARVLQQSAFEHDVAAVHGRLCDLREALKSHMDAEHGAFDGVSDAATRVVRSGQRELIEGIDELIGLASGEHPDCRCIEGTSRVTSMLRRQARLEARIRD